jgi:hypothetical protein
MWQTQVFSVPKEAKVHTYELLTSTAIRAELAGPVSEPHQLLPPVHTQCVWYVRVF